jgi:hypothetical protein
VTAGTGLVIHDYDPCDSQHASRSPRRPARVRKTWMCADHYDDFVLLTEETARIHDEENEKL